MADYVPANDAEFDSWQNNLVLITESQLVTWGILVGDFTLLKTAQSGWVDGYDSAEVKTVRNNGDVAGKDSTRAVYEKALRKFNKQWLISNTRVSDRERELMGLTVPVETRTPAPKPTTKPVVTINFAQRLQHELHIVDEATPTRKAKPVGVHGCEIWMKIDGPAPVSVSELSYVATTTRTPGTVIFEGIHAGKIVYYWLRWVNTRGEHGPWSNVVSAMVVG